MRHDPFERSQNAHEETGFSEKLAEHAPNLAPRILWHEQRTSEGCAGAKCQ
jgi:hypothetical protein